MSGGIFYLSWKRIEFRRVLSSKRSQNKSDKVRCWPLYVHLTRREKSCLPSPFFKGMFFSFYPFLFFNLFKIKNKRLRKITGQCVWHLLAWLSLFIAFEAVEPFWKNERVQENSKCRQLSCVSLTAWVFFVSFKSRRHASSRLFPSPPRCCACNASRWLTKTGWKGLLG